MKEKRIKEKDRNAIIEFEIKFYEKLLEEQPNFTACAKVLAELYTKTGMYNKGLELDRKLSCLLPSDGRVFYNLACSYSLMGDIENALKSIQRAVELGFNDYNFMLKDPDLINLRKDKRFEDILSKNYK